MHEYVYRQRTLTVATFQPSSLVLSGEMGSHPGCCSETSRGRRSLSMLREHVAAVDPGKVVSGCSRDDCCAGEEDCGLPD